MPPFATLCATVMPPGRPKTAIKIMETSHDLDHPASL